MKYVDKFRANVDKLVAERKVFDTLIEEKKAKAAKEAKAAKAAK